MTASMADFLNTFAPHCVSVRERPKSSRISRLNPRLSSLRAIPCRSGTIDPGSQREPTTQSASPSSSKRETICAIEVEASASMKPTYAVSALTNPSFTAPPFPSRWGYTRHRRSVSGWDLAHFMTIAGVESLPSQMKRKWPPLPGICERRFPIRCSSLYAGMMMLKSGFNQNRRCLFYWCPVRCSRSPVPG